MLNLVALAEGLAAGDYSELERPARYSIRTTPRQARERHKDQVVSEREFKTLKLIGEEVAEFDYRPVACRKSYRMIVLRKKLVAEKGQLWLFEPDRCFFYITNDRTTPASEIVFLANDRCDQENVIGQLKGGREGPGDAGGRPGEQRGVHGHGGPGVEPEGLGGPVAARAGSMVGEAPIGEAIVVADGVQHILCGDDPGTLPGRADVPAGRVPLVVVEPVARHLPEVGGAAARAAVVLRVGCGEAGVWMSRSELAPSRGEGVNR